MKTKNQKTGIIYCRVSSTSNGNLLLRSLKSQEAECRKMAKEDGVRIVETIVEAGSGLNLWREGLVRLAFSVQAKNADMLYVFSLDRLTRVANSVALLEKALNTTVKSVMEPVGILNPEEQFLSMIMASTAKYQSDAHSRSIKRGWQKRRMKCVCGSPMTTQKVSGRRKSYTYLKCKNCHLVKKV